MVHAVLTQSVRLILPVFNLFVHLSAQAQDWPTDQELLSVLSPLTSITQPSDRALEASRLLLGRPYVLGPCGEGDHGDYDTKPICSLQSFDCTTFVEPVLAFAFTSAKSLKPIDEFKAHLLDIKYSDANEVIFVNRNHFTELHWASNAIKKKYLEDVTTQIDPNSPIRMKWLDVNGWYQGLVDGVQHNATLSQTQKDDYIAALTKDSSNKKTAPLAQLHYVPLASLLTPTTQKKLQAYKILLFNLVKNENTNTNIPVIVAHQGFIVNLKGRLYLRHASSAKNAMATVDIPFNDYIQARMKDTTWPTLGMNLMNLVE